ncbi:MAG: Nre family DNA repair protein [Nitrososphaerales archaeon]
MGIEDILPRSIVEALGEGIRVSGRVYPTLCLACRGAKMLCGKARCPILLKAEALVKIKGEIDREQLAGSTPPAAFVGRLGYPKVYVGPLIPHFYGDTVLLDTPEWWLGRGIEEIVSFRYNLIRGKSRVDVKAASTGHRLLDTLQELALSTRSVDAEAVFEKKPTKMLILSDITQPFGPSAPLRSFKAADSSVDKRIEKAYYDKDLKAAEAVADLYRKGVMVTRIQRAFSLGMFGEGKRRRLVPTRWSITAVDSIISELLVKEVRNKPTVDKYLVYYLKNIGNLYIAVLMPKTWSFEWIEAWFPGTPWNPEGASSKPALMGDYEGYWGRKTYPAIGGCYYSTRLAVAEALNRYGRQATALVLREIYPEYILPVGVWNVRESVRAAFKSKSLIFDTLEDVLKFVKGLLKVPLRSWIEHSVILREALHQKSMKDYL